MASQNILIVGPCGTGKTFLACALAHTACLSGYTSCYYCLPRLLADLQLSKGDGRYKKQMEELAKVNVLILDDFGFAPFTDEHRRDLLELIDDRHEKRSTIVTGQLPVKLWHETIGNGILADVILDRLVHNAHRFEKMSEINEDGPHFLSGTLFVIQENDDPETPMVKVIYTESKDDFNWRMNLEKRFQESNKSDEVESINSNVSKKMYRLLLLKLMMGTNLLNHLSQHVSRL